MCFQGSSALWRVGALLLTRLGPPCAWPHPQPPVFQEPSYLDDLSNASIFSSSLDSLSDIVDTPDFLPADRLSQVPTIWDVSTGPPAHNKVSAPSVAVWTPRGCGAPHPLLHNFHHGQVPRCRLCAEPAGETGVPRCQMLFLLLVLTQGGPAPSRPWGQLWLSPPGGLPAWWGGGQGCGFTAPRAQGPPQR